jgi:hypothetical protein
VRRKRAIWLGVGVALMGFLLADAFVAPPAHDVHSPGGAPVKVTFFYSNNTVAWVPSQPSQSLADMKCRMLRTATKCDATTLATYFPSLTQSAQTLYLNWSNCTDWYGAGEITRWEGYNVEYIASIKELVIHCYRAKPWLYAHDYLYGVAAVPQYALATMSTVGMGSGTITIMEDDHLEHLVGDQSDGFQLATATIS